jgi:hypothetical protein
MKKSVINKIKPQFWRTLKRHEGLDPKQFTLGRAYPIVGMLKNTHMVYVIDDYGDRVSLDGHRLGLKPVTPKPSAFDILKEIAKDFISFI